MPVRVEPVNDKYRVVEASNGNISKNKNGKAVDGGGFDSRKEAQKQANAINASLSDKGSI